MTLGRNRPDWRNENVIADEPAAAVPHDLIAQLADILANPAQTAKAIADLGKASAVYKADRTRAQAERDAAAIATSQLAADRQKHADKVAADEAAFDKRCAEREVALSAREKRPRRLTKSARPKSSPSTSAAKRRGTRLDAFGDP